MWVASKTHSTQLCHACTVNVCTYWLYESVLPQKESLPVGSVAAASSVKEKSNPRNLLVASAAPSVRSSLAGVFLKCKHYLLCLYRLRFFWDSRRRDASKHVLFTLSVCPSVCLCISLLSKLAFEKEKEKPINVEEVRLVFLCCLLRSKKKRISMEITTSS